MKETAAKGGYEMTDRDNTVVGGSAPLLSIVIPVYNVEKYLNCCIDSCLAQDVQQTEYEIICVDDGSPDSCGTILDSYAQQNHNIHVIHKENGGVSSARNTGIESAAGKYIWFVDSDDFIGRNILSGILSALKEKNCDELAVYAFAFNDGEECEFGDIQPSQKSQRYKDYLWTRIYRLSIIMEHEIRFNPQVTYAEDNLFCTLLKPYILTRAEWNQSIAVFYRLRQGSLSRAATEKRITSYIAASADMHQLANSHITDDVSVYTNMYTWMSAVMTYAASLPEDRYRELLQTVKEKGVFPLRLKMKYRPHSARPEYGFKKRIRAFLRDISYTRIGLFLLRTIFR